MAPYATISKIMYPILTIYNNDGLYEVNYDYDGHVQPHLMTPSVYTDVSYYLEFINQNTNLDLTAYGDLTGTNCKSDTHTSNFGFASNSQQNNDPSTKISDSHRLIKLNDPIGPIIEYKVLNHSVRYDEFMYGWCIAATQTTVNDWIFDANDPNSITNSIYNYLSNTAVDKTDTYKRQRGFYKANDFTRDNNIRHPFQIIPRICKQGSPFTEWAYDAATKQIYSVMTKLPKRKNGAYKLHSAWCWTYGNHQQGIFVLPCRENDLKQKFEIETVKKVNHLSSTASFAQGTNVEYHEMITNHPALNNVKHIYTVNPRRVLQFKKLRPVQFLKSPNFKSKTNTYFHINTDFDYLKTLIPTGTAAGEIFSISPIEAIGNSWNTGCIAPTKYLAGKFVRIMPQSTSVSSKCKFGMYKLHDSSFSDDAIMIKVVNEQNNDNLCFKIRYDVSRNLKQTALKLAVCNEADRYQQFSRRQWNMQGGNLKQLCIAEKEHFCLIFTRTMTLNLNTRQTHGLEVVEGLQTKNRGNQLVQSQYWCNTHSSSGIDCQAIPSTAGRYCPGMWTGDNCDIEPVTCKPWQKLLDNGICRDYECICRTSRGYAIDWENDSYATKSLCNRDSRICRSCKNGWTGEECISNTCDLDLRNWSSSTAVCGSCKNGMYGPNCDENCDNNGVYDAGTDSCTCSGYWTGDRCDVSTQSCSGSQFTGNYNSDGSCSCTGYWTGLNCDVTSLDCSHRTTQFDGTCVGQCDTGYHESETAPYNCVPNVCECTYGEGAQGTNCSVPGTNKCGVCNYGYHLNTVTYTCDLNQCTCAGYWWSNSYDFSTEGTYCPVNGATGCYQCEFTHNLGPEIIATPTNYVEIINSNTPVLDYNNTVINNFRLHEKFRLQMKLKFAYDYDLPNGQKRPLSDYLEQVRSFGLISFYHPNITATPFAREFDIVGYFDNVLCQPICQPTDSVSFYVTWTIRDAAAEIQTADSRYMIMHTVTPGQWYDFTFEYSPRRRAIYVDHKKVFDTTDIDYYENTPPSEFWQQYHPNDLPGATSVYPTFGYDGTLVLAYAKGGDSTGYGNDNNMNYYQINKAPITFGSVTYQELTQEPNPTCHDMNYRECICPNGTPIDPALCPSDGANYCSKCDQGYKYNEATHTCDYENCGYGHYWRDVDETCQENWCVCTEHPTEQYASASGQGCKVDGGYGCNYCPANYTKGYDRNLTASNSLDIISTPYLLDMPDPCSPNCAPGVILNNIHFYEKFRFSMRLKFNSLPSETGMSATYFKLASFINPEVTTANILNHDQDDREFELDGWQDLELNGDISLTVGSFYKCQFWV